MAMAVAATSFFMGGSSLLSRKYHRGTAWSTPLLAVNYRQASTLAPVSRRGSYIVDGMMMRPDSQPRWRASSAKVVAGGAASAEFGILGPYRPQDAAGAVVLIVGTRQARARSMGQVRERGRANGDDI